MAMVLADPEEWLVIARKSKILHYREPEEWGNLGFGLF